MKSVKVAVVDVQLKQGLFGIKVRILPPTVDFLDKPTIKPGNIPPAKATPTEPEQPVTTEVELEEKKEEQPVGSPAQA